jgi:hypothetical protein
MSAASVEVRSLQMRSAVPNGVAPEPVQPGSRTVVHPPSMKMNIVAASGADSGMILMMKLYW